MHEALDHTFINGIGCSDWMAERSAQQRFEELIPKVQDGDIILLHDFTGNDNTVAALRMIIPKLNEMGFGFLTVSQLFEKKGVTPSAHNGYIYTNVLQNTSAQYR
jgi:peptidoglycan/xylan/chitin deacetylase (PgdA/CDA1 family)